MCVPSVARGVDYVLKTGVFKEKYEVFKTKHYKNGIEMEPEFSLSSKINRPESLFTQDEMKRLIGVEYKSYVERYKKHRAHELEKGYNGVKRVFAGYPQNYNGGCYQGPAALALQLKMAADNLMTPVFLNREQMEALNVAPLPEVDGVSVLHKDNNFSGSIVRTKVYALDETTFPEKFPEYYEHIKDYFKNQSYSIIGTYKEDFQKCVPLDAYKLKCPELETMSEKELAHFMLDNATGSQKEIRLVNNSLQRATPTEMFHLVNEVGLSVYIKQRETNSLIQKGVNIDELNVRISKVLKTEQQERTQQQSENAARSRGIK